MRAYQPGAATSIEVTGQSGQSKLHTVGEHRPGGPIGPPNRTTRTYVGPAVTMHYAGPGAAWLWTNGEAGPGTDVKPAHWRPGADSEGRRSSPRMQPQPEARSGLGGPEVKPARTDMDRGPRMCRWEPIPVT